MLKLLNISASYQDFLVLENISLEISAQKFYGIIGPNGAGKTTLLKTMTRIKRPESGNVRLLGKNISKLANKEIAKIMAVVPQSSFIPPLFTVEEVVSMGRYPFQNFRFSDTKEDRSIVDAAIEKTGIHGFRSR
ncbi:MAG: ABC transporter ATP-binding protein, partial [Proteobacteria bacterium]|nr:ABC transporter ATP-binding protein [Pseudomonadota bacterium]